MAEVASSRLSNGSLSDYHLFSKADRGFTLSSMDVSEQAESIAGSSRSTNYTIASTMTPSSTLMPTNRKKSLKVSFTPSVNFKDDSDHECHMQTFAMDAVDETRMTPTNSDDWYRDRSNSLAFKYDAMEALTTAQVTRKSEKLSLGENTEVHSMDVQDLRHSLAVTSEAGSRDTMAHCRSSLYMHYDALDIADANDGEESGEDSARDRAVSWHYENLEPKAKESEPTPLSPCVDNSSEEKTLTSLPSESAVMMRVDSEEVEKTSSSEVLQEAKHLLGHIERVSSGESIREGDVNDEDSASEKLGKEIEPEDLIPNFPPIRVSQAQLVWRKSTNLKLQSILGLEAGFLEDRNNQHQEAIATLSGQSMASSSSRLSVTLVRTDSTEPQVCSCGSIFTAECRFCRRCGKRRAEVGLYLSGESNQSTAVHEAAAWGDVERQNTPEQAIWKNVWAQQPQYESASSGGTSSPRSPRDSLKDEWGWDVSLPSSESEDLGHRDVPSASKSRRRSSSSPPPNVFWRIFSGQFYDLCCTGDNRERPGARAPRRPSRVRLESPPAMPDILRKSLKAKAEHPE